MLLERFKEVKERVDLLGVELSKPENHGRYSWAAIKEAFEHELPILNAEVIERFHSRLMKVNHASPLPTVEPAKRRKKYGIRRRLPDGFPKALELSGHIIDYLRTCENMTASKTDIYNSIKNQYPAEFQTIPHRSRGEDNPDISALEYRSEWACTILVSNMRAIGRNQDPTIPVRYIKLVNVNKFTDAEMEYIKKNNNSLVGFKAKKN